MNFVLPFPFHCVTPNGATTSTPPATIKGVFSVQKCYRARPMKNPKQPPQTQTIYGKKTARPFNFVNRITSEKSISHLTENRSTSGEEWREC